MASRAWRVRPCVQPENLVARGERVHFLRASFRATGQEGVDCGDRNKPASADFQCCDPLLFNPPINRRAADAQRSRCFLDALQRAAL